MGWRLAEEVAWGRPERPGPEWWTLLDLAQSGSDDTRQAWPGREYLMVRGRCSRATLYRRLRALAGAGLITVAVPSARGRRAVYEISTAVAEMAAAHQVSLALRPDTGLTDAETRPPPEAAQRVSSEAQRVSSEAPTGLSSGESPPVSTPVSTPVRDHVVLTSPVPVEHARARPGQPPDISGNGHRSPRTAEETAAEARRQADALTDWIRQHPETAP